MRISLFMVLIAAACLVAMPPHQARAAGKVEGTFIVSKTDARLQHVRATTVKLDAKGTMGYAILMSAKPAEGDITSWQSADPSERGSFIYLVLEKNGAVWIAELGHAAAKNRFGVVSEVTAPDFTVKGDQLSAKLRTAREQEFSGNRYTIDLTFTATLEPPK